MGFYSATVHYQEFPWVPAFWEKLCPAVDGGRTFDD